MAFLGSNLDLGTAYPDRGLWMSHIGTSGRKIATFKPLNFLSF
jgi:hypothetical protein